MQLRLAKITSALFAFSLVLPLVTACPGGGKKDKEAKGDDKKGDDRKGDDRKGDDKKGDDKKGDDKKGGDDKKPPGAAFPCVGKLKKVESGGETTYAKLSCTGVCPDGTKCEWKKTTNDHGATREWCGCDPVEPEDACYIVLHTSADGKKVEPICPPRDCDPGETCTLEETKTADGGNIKTYSLTCACK